MKTKIDMGARILLGLMFVVFGLNGFFNFLPQPAAPERLMKFVGALFETGYFMQFVKACEIICGVLLLANVYVPLSLLILAPICINIFLAHAFLAPEGLPVAIVVNALGCAIAWARCEKFSEVLKMK